jgi:hypothetical protein
MPLAILCAAIAFSLSLDAVLYWRGGYDATITAWLLSSPKRAGVFGFAIGSLFGHLFL